MKLFQQSDSSLLFNMLYRFVIAFLPRIKRLLISLKRLLISLKRLLKMVFISIIIFKEITKYHKNKHICIHPFSL